MNIPSTDSSDLIDRNISRWIREAVAEGLQLDLCPEASCLSPHLQHLLDQLRKRETGNGLPANEHIST